MTRAGGAAPTKRPTTCGVRSADTGGYCSHTCLPPPRAAVVAGRPSRPAVAA
ncbi:MAG: hypothetical protein HS111_23365 [Kofleriaceae bacterium]|nr:hypothetical protein [Kofleriaceae bacterium]